MGERAVEIIETIAHIRLPDGAVFQVLNQSGDDWDEAATTALVQEHLARQAADPAPTPPAAPQG
jgi:hypothetical protein